MSRKGFWTTKELAERAGLDRSHIRRLLIQGKLQGEKLGRDWVVFDGEVERWFKARKAAKSREL